MLSLKQRTIRAGALFFTGYGLSQVIRMASNLLMTRMLMPEYFGLVGIATTLLTGLALFSDLGIRQNIIHSARGDEADFLNTAWVVQILRGGVIWVLALGLSAIVFGIGGLGLFEGNSVYANHQLPLVMAVLALSAVISGFESTRILQANRKLHFKLIVRIEIISQLVGLFSMYVWATLDRSIWALVSGALIAGLVKTVLSHTMLEGTANRWTWDSGAFKEISAYGKWIFLSSILGFFVANCDRVILGGLVSAEVLGVYSVAYLLVNAVETALARIIGTVVFPVLSEVSRDSPGRLREVFYRFHMIIGIAAIFVAGVLYGSGETIVSILYDRRYAGAGWMMSLLSLSLTLVPYAVAQQCFLALGKPSYLSMLSGLRIPVLCIGIPLCFHFLGLRAAVAVIAMGSAIALPLYWFYQKSLGILDLRREFLIWLALPPGLAVGYFIAWAWAAIMH